MKRLIILCSVSIFFFFSINLIFAHPPHKPDWTADSNKLVNCSNCHVGHNAVGASLTKDVNAVLCMSCHVTTSSAASEKPFADADQANYTTTPTTGSSHRWDGFLPAADSPNNAYGLRPAGSLTTTSLKNAALKFKNPVTGAGGVTCSTCHAQHNQSLLPWDPDYGTASNTPTGITGYRGTASATAGDNVTIIDGAKSWAVDQWANSLVVISSPNTSPNYNKERRITGNTATQLTVSRAFPQAVALNETYSITSGRHYQRMNNTENAAANDMCIDCHYYRATAAATDVKTYDGNKKSHPIGKNLTTDVADAAQFVGAAPFEPSSACWAAQAGPPRYAQNNGGSCSLFQYCNEADCIANSGIWTSEGNSTNNIILDSNSKVRCMSCHSVHYADSDSSTEDRSHNDRLP